ncbi:MAG: PilW family protein [Candidatus Thiodiazotropha sp. (ex Codakia orbicularis)]|nr:PilW family protein [Candidatus Thiodiazotropha sp. (ex Codakia orbicularis)]
MMNRTIPRQAGFSLVSLLISSAIGVFLIGGAGKIYLDSKNAFTARSAIAAATESSRFAMQDFRRYLVMAGRGIGENEDSPETYSAADNNLRTFPAMNPDNSVASSTTGIIDQDNNGNSVIAVRYAIGPTPCGQGGTINNTHTIRFYRNNEGQLMCQSIETIAGTLDTANQYERPLLSGVVSMQALYGVDTDTGPAEDQIANQYLTATEVENAGLWISVVSIRIGIVISSDTEELPYTYRPATAEPMGLLGMDVPTPDNSHAYKATSTTITFRNLNTISMSRQGI